MNITNNTILITGGGSGIGLEIAKVLSPANKIIIVGRNKEKLDAAAKDLENVFTIQGDITNENDVKNAIRSNFGAGRIIKTNIVDDYSDMDLQKVLGDLPENYKTIIILRFFEDLKIQEIAKILNLNENTVKTRLYKSLKILRIKLGDEEDINEL